MSYRDPAQSIEGPLNTILEGLRDGGRELDDALCARIVSKEWTEEHISELMLLLDEVAILRRKLVLVESRNW